MKYDAVITFSVPLDLPPDATEKEARQAAADLYEREVRGPLTATEGVVRVVRTDGPVFVGRNAGPS